MSPGKHYIYFLLLFLAFMSSRMMTATVGRFCPMLHVFGRDQITQSQAAAFLQLYFCIFVRDDGLTLI